MCMAGTPDATWSPIAGSVTDVTVFDGSTLIDVAYTLIVSDCGPLGTFRTGIVATITSLGVGPENQSPNDTVAALDVPSL